MIQSMVETNTLYYELACPKCSVIVHSGIGFRIGHLQRISYRLGETIKWNGNNCRPSKRPKDGNIKTIGYFNCDNPRCETWKDCFPEIQEALIVIENDVITDVSPIKFKPGEQSYAILEPEGVV